MKKTVRHTAFLLILFIMTGSAFASDIDTLLPILKRELSSERAYEYVSRIWQYDKWCTLPMWQKSAREVQAIMNERGFDEALVIDTPADGVTKYGDWTNPVGWDCKSATLEIIEPRGLPDEYRFLCNYKINPTSLTFFSCPTPPEGIATELVILDQSTPEALEKIDARGKMVLMSSRAGYMKKFLDKNGAIGILSDQQVGPHPDANVWLNTWTDVAGGWMMTAKDSKKNFCFSISQSKGEFIRDLIKSGKTVKVRAKIDSRYYTDDSLPYVTGLVKGSGPEGEEVLIGGHLFEWGANDNATGCAIMLESVGTLNDLIREGVLPRPKRSIRVWMGQEMYGSLPFTERYIDNLRKTVAAVCCDTPAPQYDLLSSTIKVFMNPNVNPTYTDALFPEVIRQYYRSIRSNKQVLIEPFEGGTDTYFTEPLIGAPTHFIYMENGTWLHHNSRDTIARVDKKSLRDLCVVNALYLYYLADAGIDELPYIAPLTYDRGISVVLEKTADMKARVHAAKDGESLGKALAEGVRTIEYYTGLQQQALKSIVRLSKDADKQSAGKKLKRYVDDTAAFGKLCVKQFRDDVAEKAKDSSLKVTKYKKKQTAWDKEASTIRPIAVKFGTLTLDSIPNEEWTPITRSPRWWSTRNFPASSYWWCDGTRNLVEIKELIEMEAGRTVGDFDLIAYYRLLEKHDLVEFEK